MKKEFIFEISKSDFDDIEFTCNDIIAAGGIPAWSAADAYTQALIYNNIVKWDAELDEEEASQRCKDYNIRVIFKGAD